MKPTKKSRPPYRLGDRKQLSQKPPLTPELLNELLEKASNSRYRAPSIENLIQLSTTLNRYHEWFYHTQKVRRLNKLRDQGREAIDTLKNIVPELLDACTTAAETGDPFARRQQREAESAANFLKFDSLYLHEDRLPDGVPDWKWVVRALPPQINATLQHANPGLTLGNSKGGPMSRILEAIIPIISGETPGAIAIGTQLTLNARKKSKKAD